MKATKVQRGGGDDTCNRGLSERRPLRVKTSYELTLLEPQSRFGDKPVKFQVVCPQHGTAVLKGLSRKSESDDRKKTKTKTSSESAYHQRCLVPDCFFRRCFFFLRLFIGAFLIAIRVICRDTLVAMCGLVLVGILCLQYKCCCRDG